jgi:hypothetical protein
MRRFGRTTKILVVTIVAGGAIAAAAGAAAVGIVSGKIAIFSEPITHASCTIPGTGVSNDSYTQQASPNATAGTATTISISPLTNNRRYGWLMFNLAACGIPAGAQVDSATLSVRVTTAATGRTITVTEATSTWTEGAVTWNTNPSVAGTATGTFSAATTGAKTVDVSADVADWISGAASNFGWRLADLGASAVATSALGSSENGMTTNRPTLAITYAQ